jgi:ribulose-phosphate 3-epimerase
MMCADYAHLADDIKQIEVGGANILHCDIMDGTFVPNFGMGRQDFETVRRLSDLPADVHLMIGNPDRYVELFASLGADIIYIHPEAGEHAGQTLRHIKDLGKAPGIALNPATLPETVEFLLPLASYILCMTVNPGFYGQTFMESAIPKLRKLVEWKSHYQYKLIADGGVTPELITRLTALGVDGFVLGSSLFEYADRSERIKYLRSL